jgi:hypothetical protein
MLCYKKHLQKAVPKPNIEFQMHLFLLVTILFSQVQFVLASFWVSLK